MGKEMKRKLYFAMKNDGKERKFNIKVKFSGIFLGTFNFYDYFCKKQLLMEQKIFIELLESGEKVSLYSPRFEGEEYTEFEKFLLTYKENYLQDIHILVRRIDIIKANGAEDRFFRYEGRRKDRVMALPSHFDTSNLRLYCLNINHKILILENGGLKNSQTYQEDPTLHKAVQTLQRIDIKIKQLENKQVITISGTNLNGPLELSINTDN